MSSSSWSPSSPASVPSSIRWPVTSSATLLTSSSCWATTAMSATVARSSISIAVSARVVSSSRRLCRSSVASSWCARPSSAPESCSTYRSPAANTAIVRIDLLTEMTGKPVCRAARSAVRCRVPDSCVGSAGSGTSCTAARRIRRAPVSSTIAPSILASSRSRVAENSASSSKPPEQMRWTAASEPTTIKAPVLPRTMRSSPSRRAVPGATIASAARRRSSPTMLTECTYLSALAVTRSLVTGKVRSERRDDGRAHVCDGRDPNAPSAAVGRSYGLQAPGSGGCDSGRQARSGGNDRAAEADPLRLGNSPLQAGDPADLAGQSDLTDGYQIGWHADIRDGAGDRQAHGQVDRRLGQPSAADAGGEHIAAADSHARAPLQDCQHHGDPRRIQSGHHPPRRQLGHGGAHERLNLGEQRPPPFERHRDAGPRYRVKPLGQEQPAGVRQAGEPVLAKLEAAEFVRRAKPVLQRTHHAQLAVLISVEVQHDVDQVLERPRSGNRAVLGDMTDQDGGQRALLGQCSQR